MDFLDLAIDRVQPRTRLGRRPFSLMGDLVYLRLELLCEGRDHAADRECAEHVQQLGGESPLSSLMAAKD